MRSLRVCGRRGRGGRRRKKKGGPLRALSSKAWSTDDFFAGLREEGEDAKTLEEEESEDDSD